MAYGTNEGLQAWLDAMGYVLPENAPSLAILRARGSAYLDGSYEALWTGRRLDPMQENAWPRTGARMGCTVPVPEDGVPPMVERAAYRAAWLEATSPGSLSIGAVSGQRIAREKVDVIEVAYHNDGPASAGSGGIGFVDAEIDGAMRTFICDVTGGFFFRVVG